MPKKSEGSSGLTPVDLAELTAAALVGAIADVIAELDPNDIVTAQIGQIYGKAGELGLDIASVESALRDIEGMIDGARATVTVAFP